jgi:hypothetical protein
MLGIIGLAAIVRLGIRMFGAGPVPVMTETVRLSQSSGNSVSVLDASGYVVARRQATVSSKITGKVLAVLGGIPGGGIAWLFLNGYTVSTLNGTTFSQVVFDFAVSPDLLVQGLIAAVVIGLVGGSFPGHSRGQNPRLGGTP